MQRGGMVVRMNMRSCRSTSGSYCVKIQWEPGFAQRYFSAPSVAIWTGHATLLGKTNGIVALSWQYKHGPFRAISTILSSQLDAFGSVQLRLRVALSYRLSCTIIGECPMTGRLGCVV